MSKLRVGVVGAGVFGGYHAAKAAGSDLAALAGVADLRLERARALAEKFGAAAVGELTALLPMCDAVIVATAAPSHASLAQAALSAGVHALVEKPLAMSVAEAEALADLADARGLVLQAGHQERLAAAALGLLAAPSRPLAFEAVREGPFPGAERVGDVSVVWDLMIHDIDLAQLVMGPGLVVDRVEAASSVTDHADAVQATLRGEGGRTVRLRASRIAEARSRRLDLTYAEGRISVDFLTRTVENTTPFAIDPGAAAQHIGTQGAADEGILKACLGIAGSPATARSVSPAIRIAADIHANLAV